MHCSFPAPDDLLYTPYSTPGRWLQILQGPLSIPLAKSHIPEEHMFHLKPTRFALPSGAKEKTLAPAAHFLGEVGVGKRPLGRSKLSCGRTFEFMQSKVQNMRHPHSLKTLQGPSPRRWSNQGRCLWLSSSCLSCCLPVPPIPWSLFYTFA